MLLNELKKENDRFKQMINSKAKDSEEIVQVQETIESDSYMCNECDFVGKTEPGLKIHKKAKHKETQLRGYRKVNPA